MLRSSRSVESICDGFLEDVRGIWGDGLESVILYGSAARGEFTPKSSDLNFLVVTENLAPPILRGLQPVCRKWKRRRISTPLLMRREMIRTSLDSYPLEFLSIMAAYRVLHGEDVLEGIELEREDVRLQCERELKSKLLLLREAYVDSAGSRHLLHQLISRSLPAMTAIFQGLLFLLDRPWKLRGDELLQAGREAFGLDEGLFRRLWQIKRRKDRPGSEETHQLMGRYLDEVLRLAEWADRGGLTAGGGS